jgi:UDP-N-acetylmuramoyl-tripeptide--D-alanyl-D-alanine ligase
VFTINDLTFALTGHTIPQMDITISATVIDSRNAIESSLFIALPGEKVNGHDFVGAAFDNGAIAAIIDQSMPQ